MACERLAVLAGAELGELATRCFPDGESYVRVESAVASREVILVDSLARPNHRTLELVFAADALRELGATCVGLVAPYLPYMRQDARFNPGEAITSRSFAAVLSRSFDWLLTVDPHLHRIARLTDLYSIPARVVHAAPALGAWIAAHVSAPLIVGPDAESRQWVDAVARAAGAPSTVMTKTRRGDRDVVEAPADLAGHLACTPVVVDDIISTGKTMGAAIAHLREQGMPPAVCVAVHAVFADGANDTLRAAGAGQIVTTNTIPHPSNGIDVLPAIADALRTALKGSQ